MNNSFKRFMLLLILSITIAAGCRKEKEIPDDQQSSTTPIDTSNLFTVDLVHATLSIEDENMLPPSGDATLLWNSRGHTPILAPDGHHITLGEFNSVSGKAGMKCIIERTAVAIQLKDLIPNGVYTIWILTFKTPGFHGTFDNLIGYGALGLNDGSMNAFTASSSGEATVLQIMPAGPMSVFGSVENCLSSEYEIQLVADYHLDNLTHGSSPGDSTKWVTQFSFPFHGGF